MKTTLTIEQSAELIKRGVSKDKASAAVIYLDYAGEEVEPRKVFKRDGDGVLLTRLRSGMVDGVEAKIVLKNSDSNYSVPIFTLADLLSLLPKKLYGEETDYCDCELHIHANKLGWSASYMEIRGSEVVVMKLTSYGVELIDALFSLVCKLLDNHVKLD